MITITKHMFGLHKNESGDVLAASDFKNEYDLGSWVRSLDLRHGDFIEFRDVAARPERDEGEPFKPAFLNDEAEKPLEVGALATASATASVDEPF